jgi:SAM-dependent methyltransferase
VLAIEPSAAMRAQRPAHLTPAIDGVAERLPIDNQSFDAAMALVTVHQWPDLAKGLQELRRVTRGPIVVLTFDPDALDRYWMADYAPEMLAVERRGFPPVATLVEGLGGACETHALRIPNDCVDGFSQAFYARPPAFLDPAVRRSQWAWSFVPDAVQARIVERLGADLASGEWDRRHGAWRAAPFFEGSLRGSVSRPPR